MRIMTKIYCVKIMLESGHVCCDEPTGDYRAYLRPPWLFAALK